MYVPKRTHKKNSHPKINEKEGNKEVKDNPTFKKHEIDEILKKCKQNLESNQEDLYSFSSQIKRFYELSKKQKFQFYKNSSIEKLVEKQINRGIAKEFYKFIKIEFLKKGEEEKHTEEDSFKSEIKINIIKKYIRYQIGREKLEKK